VGGTRRGGSSRRQVLPDECSLTHQREVHCTCWASHKLQKALICGKTSVVGAFPQVLGSMCGEDGTACEIPPPKAKVASQTAAASSR
jgi:hypothetical protein